MAGEVEGAGKPDARRDVERGAAGVVEVADAEDGLPERVGVQIPAVANAAEVGDGDGLWAVLHRHDAGAGRGIVGGCLEEEEEEDG